MNSKRLYFLLLAMICLLVFGLIGGTYNANNLLTERASKLTNLKAKSLALAEQQVSVNKSKKDIEKYAELDKIAKAVVPEDKDQAQAVREIVNIADKYNVKLATIGFPASTLGNSAVPGTTTPAPAAAGTTPNASASKSNAGALSQLTPVKNIPGVYQLQINVQSDSNKPVAYGEFIKFLSALERNRRTAQVSTITIEPSTANRGMLSFNLTLNQYIKP